MTEADQQAFKATILEIQRMSTEDGPGIRKTIFFKGCSLKCAWCHNPESISTETQFISRDIILQKIQSCTISLSIFLNKLQTWLNSLLVDWLIR